MLSVSDEPTCYDHLARAIRGRLLRLAFGMVGDHHEAEDLVQQALLRLHDRWEAVEQPRAFARRVLTNLCIDRLRARGARPGGAPAALSDALPAAARPEPAEQREQARAVRAALDTLGHDQRAALLLREVEELSYREIAAALAATEAQVTNWIHRAKHKLRERLQEQRP